MKAPKDSQCRTCKASLPEGEDAPFFPFCSKRCRMLDLGKWLSGDYQISEEIPFDLEDDEFYPDTDARLE